MHCHNNCESGVAVSIAGIEAGASMVQEAMNGRVGITKVTPIIPNLNFKLSCQDEMNKLRSVSFVFDNAANRRPSKKEPFVGLTAFAHKRGVHANAAKKVAPSYEHIISEVIDNSQLTLLSDMSGGSSTAIKAKLMGIELADKSPEMRVLLQKIKKIRE